MFRVTCISVCFILLAAGCGSKKSDEDKFKFADDIQPILQNSCGVGNGTCHDQSIGDSGANYVGNKDLFLAVASDVKMRIATSDIALKMPKPGYNKTLSTADAQKLMDYLDQDSHD